MYVGPFYFDTKELILILTAVLLGFILYFRLPLPYFNREILFLLVILILITKGLLPAVHNEAFFILVLVTIVLSLSLPLFQLILFFFLSFFLFRLLRVI